MSSKTSSIPSKPKRKETPPARADDWVENRTTEATKRLTLDIPASLHARIKSTCALRQVKMVDEIRELLEQHFGE